MAMEFNNAALNVLASVSAFPVPTPFASVSFWLRYTSLVGNIRRLLGSGGNFEVRGGNGAGTQPPGQVVTDLFVNTDGAQSVTLLTVGPWFHVVTTGEFTAGNSITDVYLNGVLDAGPLTVAGANVAAAIMTLGNRTGVGSADVLNGLLDDVRFYNRRLSAAEIQSIFSARGRDSVRQGLLSRITFPGGVPGTSPVGVGSVKDYGPTGIHYSPTGSPVYGEKFVSGSRRRSA